MLGNQSTQGIMKIGLLVAAVIIVVRIVLEQLGSPGVINFIFGVAWLYFVIPVLFALRLRTAGDAGPFKALVKNLALFAVYTRLMVMVTYWAAYQYQWQAPRFSAAEGGNVGPDVSPLQGFLIIPVRNALILVVLVIVLGMIIGGITLTLKKKATAPAA